MVTDDKVHKAEEARRKQQEDEDDRKRREEDNRRLHNLAMGDMLNTGIPGGIDMDITTPW